MERIYPALEMLFSKIDQDSGTFEFDFSEYYEPEMGKNLQKQIISFSGLRSADDLPNFKLSTNIIEKQFADERHRIVNIDPGYLAAARIVLATTKDYDHRIYLGRGIFGDVHLRFRKGHFKPNDWTYPDYREQKILDFFEHLRTVYLQQLKEWKQI